MSEFEKQMLSRLDALSVKIGVDSTALWHACIKQSYLDGFEYLSVVIVCIIGLVMFFKLLKKVDKNSYDKEISYVGIVAGIILLMVLAINFSFMSVDCLGNPQFQAFKSLVQTLK